MPLSVSFKCCHLFGESPLTFAEPDFCQLPDSGATATALSARLCVDPCEKLVGQRDHHLRHPVSVPGNTATSPMPSTLGEPKVPGHLLLAVQSVSDRVRARRSGYRSGQR